MFGWRRSKMAALLPVVIGLLALIPYSWRQGNPQAFQQIDWWISLGVVSVAVVAVVFLANLIAAPAGLDSERATQLKQLEARLTPAVEIIFGDGPEFVHEQIIAIQGRTSRLFRVGVKNTSEVATIRHVQLDLIRVDPQPSPPIPVPFPLHLMHDNPYTPADRTDYQREFSLDPLETKYVDVVGMLDGSSKMGICHIVPRIRFLELPALSSGRVHELTLFAHGENVPSATRVFWAQIDNGRLNFSPGPPW